MSGTDQDKIDKLEEELKAARAEFEEDYNPKPKVSAESDGANVGYEFLAYVISGGLLGFGIDKFFDTLPWGMMGFIVFGFVAGVFRANKRMKQD